MMLQQEARIDVLRKSSLFLNTLLFHANTITSVSCIFSDEIEETRNWDEIFKHATGKVITLLI